MEMKRAWMWYWQKLPLRPRNYVRGQARFGAFLWAVILLLIVLSMTGIAVYAAITRQVAGVVTGLLVAVVALMGLLVLWRIRHWWWPPIRDEDLPSHNRRLK